LKFLKSDKLKLQLRKNIMKRKKLTRDSFAVLKEHFPVISIEELAGIKGGNDCLLRCFAYLDGNHSAEWYGNMLMSFMGYSTTENYRCCGSASGSCEGICVSDIVPLGSLGGLNVSEQTTGSSTVANISANLAAGRSSILVIPINGVGHAVIATGIDSSGQIQYHDPSGVYTGPINSVSKVYSVSSGSSSSSGGYYDSGGYIYSW
jgi:hypothetical protein